ncbi:unnamed protein product, partial [Boreogadus saida]
MIRSQRRQEPVRGDTPLSVGDPPLHRRRRLLRTECPDPRTHKPTSAEPRHAGEVVAGCPAPALP